MNTTKKDAQAVLPQRITHEQVFESPATFLVLPKEFVGSFKTATPGVLNVTRFRCTNTAPTNVTNILNGQEGQQILLLGDGNSTLVHGTNIFNQSGANELLASNKAYHYVRLNGKWYQVGGSSGAAVPKASSTVSGTVKTDVDNVDPVVYLKSSVDATFAPLASPVLTGDPKAPTPAGGDNDTSIATTAFVQSTVAAAIAAILKEYERRDVTVVTGSLVDQATENADFSLGTGVQSVILLKISSDVACWLRLYATSAARTADAGRAITVDPTAGTGVLAEFIFTGSITIPVSPAMWLQNLDSTVASTIYYAVTNQSGGTTAITLTFTVVTEEENNP